MPDGRTLFISHDHRDQALAEAIKQLLTRITLQQLRVWYSSDPETGGGMSPGAVWLDEVRDRLRQCRVILVLVTPRSLNRPWLHFEAGYGAADPECDVIPVCFGVRERDVPFPLGMFFVYQLADVQSLTALYGKVATAFGVPCDPEMAAPVIERAVGAFAEVVSHALEPEKVTLAAHDVAGLIDEATGRIIRHLDRRLRVSGLANPSATPAAEPEPYPVSLFIQFPERTQQHFVQILSDSTVQTVLDNLYFLLRPLVQPFQYLESWILMDQSTGERLVIREMQHRIPAGTIFTPESEWVALPLERPWHPSDSNAATKPRFVGRIPILPGKD